MRLPGLTAPRGGLEGLAPPPLKARSQGTRPCAGVFSYTVFSTKPSGQHPLEAMGTAYVGLLERRDELLALLHGFAASANDEVRIRVRKRYAELYAFVKEASGAPDVEVSADQKQLFFRPEQLEGVRL